MPSSQDPLASSIRAGIIANPAVSSAAPVAAPPPPPPVSIYVERSGKTRKRIREGVRLVEGSKIVWRKEVRRKGEGGEGGGEQGKGGGGGKE
jgi:hypothetical protein